MTPSSPVTNSNQFLSHPVWIYLSQPVIRRPNHLRPTCNQSALFNVPNKSYVIPIEYFRPFPTINKGAAPLVSLRFSVFFTDTREKGWWKGKLVYYFFGYFVLSAILSNASSFWDNPGDHSLSSC